MADRLFRANKIEANVIVEAKDFETRIARHTQIAAADPQ
ncbi:hypothetical protein X743_20870 [Mesorhizobium sp. LNHC252B00]|nr:hypothetical protein X743_20870 [Mesorhizobium sp. LNHC252B00]